MRRGRGDSGAIIASTREDGDAERPAGERFLDLVGAEVAPLPELERHVEPAQPLTPARFDVLIRSSSSHVLEFTPAGSGEAQVAGTLLVSAAER